MTSFIFPDLQTLTVLAIFQYFLLFCRLGATVMLMPGFGEVFVPANIRILLALFLTLVIFMPMQGRLPPMPQDLAGLAILVVAEVMTGLFIGSMMRLLMSVMHMAGMLIALQSGISSAIFFDPNQGTQGASVGVFLTMVALTLLFATDSHHMLLMGLLDSYDKFPVGHYPPIGDFSDFAARLLGDSFMLALMISGPVMVMGLFMYVAAGVMSRLMPSMQIFFIMMPIQILGCFFAMMLTLSACMLWYMRFFRESIASLLG